MNQHYKLRKIALIIGFLALPILMQLVDLSSNHGQIGGNSFGTWDLESPGPFMVQQAIKIPDIGLYDARDYVRPSASAMVVDSVEQIVHTVLRGETFAAIWQKYNGSVSGLDLALEAAKPTGLSLTSLRSGEELELKLLDDEIVNLTKEFKDGRKLIIDGDQVGGYIARLVEPEVFEEERTVTGTIRTSFVDAARTFEVPYDVIDEFVDLFGSRVEFRRDLQQGDVFTITYTERRTDSGRLLETKAINTASLSNQGKLLAAINYAGSDGKNRYFDEGGQALGSYFLRYPVNFTRISSVFSNARFHPIYERFLPHNGVDFAAPLGTPVRSVGDGIVEFAGRSGGAGIMVKIRHDQRYATAYLHLSGLASGIRVGSRISRGEVVGSVGMTGSATGPHLHFSLYRDGKYVDPLKADLPNLAPSVEPIPPSYLQATLMDIRERHQIVSLAKNDRPEKNT